MKNITLILTLIICTSIVKSQGKKIPIPKDIFTGEELDLSSYYSVKGEITTYKWKTKSGRILKGDDDYTNRKGKMVFYESQDDSVYCEMTNALFTEHKGKRVLRTTCITVVEPIALMTSEDIEIAVETVAPPVEADGEPVFIMVDEMPVFNGGDPQITFRKWIDENMIYPETAKSNGISGKVYVQFCVDKNGKVVDTKVIRSVDPALDIEAIRVIKGSPEWIPGKQLGKPVKVLFTFFVNFKLE